MLGHPTCLGKHLRGCLNKPRNAAPHTAEFRSQHSRCRSCAAAFSPSHLRCARRLRATAFTLLCLRGRSAGGRGVGDYLESICQRWSRHQRTRASSGGRAGGRAGGGVGDCFLKREFLGGVGGRVMYIHILERVVWRRSKEHGLGLRF